MIKKIDIKSTDFKIYGEGKNINISFVSKKDGEDSYIKTENDIPILDISYIEDGTQLLLFNEDDENLSVDICLTKEDIYVLTVIDALSVQIKNAEFNRTVILRNNGVNIENSNIPHLWVENDESNCCKPVKIDDSIISTIKFTCGKLDCNNSKVSTIKQIFPNYPYSLERTGDFTCTHSKVCLIDVGLVNSLNINDTAITDYLEFGFSRNEANICNCSLPFARMFVDESAINFSNCSIATKPKEDNGKNIKHKIKSIFGGKKEDN